MATTVTSTVVKLGNTQFSPGYAMTSGTSPTSGVSGVGDLSGPWLIEKQSLSYSYKRVPNFYFSPVSVNLSSLDSNCFIPNTQLLIRVTDVRYERLKSTDWYSTSTFTQPQRFTLYSVSSDETGTSYGFGGAAPTAGTFNVQGDMVTTQEWYFRKLWTEGDYEIPPTKWIGTGTAGQTYNSGQDGYNFYPINNLDCSVAPQDFPFERAMEWPWDESLFWMMGHWSTIKTLDSGDLTYAGAVACDDLGTALGDMLGATNIVPTIQIGYKPGTFTTGQDGAGDPQMVTDLIGQFIKSATSGGFRLPPWNHLGNNPYYEKSRHYWGG